MADLDFLAQSVKAAPSWDRDESSTNPMYPLVEKSWAGRTTKGRGKQARIVGAPFELQLTSYDNLKRAKAALYSAAEAIPAEKDAPEGLGLSLRYFGAPETAGDDTSREKISAIKNEDDWRERGGDVLLRFRVKPFKPYDTSNGDDDTDPDAVEDAANEDTDTDEE